MSKNIFILFVVLFGYASGMAQPILNQGNFAYNYPDSVIYFIADSNSIVNNTIGADVEFDYSLLRGYGLNQKGNYINPALTPGAGDFPTANMAENTDASPQNFIYSKSSADSVINIGFIVNIVGFGLTTGKYNLDPEAIMRFPFTYGNSYSDNYAGSFSAVISSIPVTTNATGNVSIVADSWGKLIFSNTLSFDTVLRVKRIEYTVTDPIVTVAGTIPAITVNGTMINYYKPSVSKAPILSFVEGSYSQSGSIIQSSKNVVSQYPLDLVSVQEMNIFESMNFYPNPSVNTSATLAVNIENPSKIKVEILNTMGQSLYEIANTGLISGNHTFVIPTNNLVPGIYFVSIEVDGKVKGAKKIVVQ